MKENSLWSIILKNMNAPKLQQSQNFLKLYKL